MHNFFGILLSSFTESDETNPAFDFVSGVIFDISVGNNFHYNFMECFFS